jgi:hypothetical protein
VSYWTGNPNGNAGVVLGAANQSFVMGLFLHRPDENGWVIGAPRGNLTGLGASYAANAALPSVTAPNAPTNLADILIALKLGTLLVGGGVGFSYNQAANLISNINGTADSTTTILSSSFVVTARGGITLPFSMGFPLVLNLGTIILLGSASGSAVSGANAAVANLNNKLSAFDFSFNVNAGATASLSQTVDLVALATFALLPQNYSATLAGANLDNTTTRIDPAGYLSFGGGVGLNWKPADTVFFDGLVTIVYGNGSWVAEAPGAGSRPADSVGWLMLRPVLGGEFKLAPWVVLRGGISAGVNWITTTNIVAAGLTGSASTVTQFSPGAAAGFGFILTEKSVLDVTLNIANFTGGGALQTFSLNASYKLDF